MDAPPANPAADRASALAADLRALVGKLKRRLREQSDVGDLTPSQMSVLLRLEKEGQATTSSLARAEGVRPQSMAVVVAALEAAGLVSGAPDPTDGRQTLRRSPTPVVDGSRRAARRGRTG
ncbi:MAG: MarR family transcriptional regulator [Caulobacteraceae bacterium]